MAGILLGPRYAAAAAGNVSLGADYLYGGSQAIWVLEPNSYTYALIGYLEQRQQWLYPAVGAGLYEAMATLDSGDGLQVSPGAGWHPISSSLQWGYNSGSSPRMGTILVSIRRISDAVLMVDEVPIEIEYGGSLGGGGGGGGPTP